MAGFLTGHPGVSFRLFQSPAPAMAAQLQAGEVDLGLASQPLPGPALASVELLSEEVLLAVPPSHRLAGRTRVTAADLAGEPFVTTRPGYWQRALTDRLFTDAVIVCEGDEPYAIRGLISAGVGIGLMPAMARRLAPDPPVGWLHLDVPCPAHAQPGLAGRRLPGGGGPGPHRVRGRRLPHLARGRLGVGGCGGRGQLGHRGLLDVGVRSGERLAGGVVDDAGRVDPVEDAGREAVAGTTLGGHGPVYGRLTAWKPSEPMPPQRSATAAATS